jgi:uncharacterized coiled-coil protein SlyX
LVSVSGSLDARLTDVELVNSLQSSDIQSLSAAIDAMGASDITRSEVAAISAGLSNDIDVVYSTLVSVSGELSVSISSVQSQVDSVTGRLTDVELVNALQSGDIQSLSASLDDVIQQQDEMLLTINSIDDRVDDIETVNTLQSTAIQELSGSVADLTVEVFNVSAALDARLTDVEIVNGLQSADIATISAAIAVIAIPSLSGYATTADVAAISGYLQSEIVDLGIVNGLQSADIASISGSLVNYALLSQLVDVSAALDSKKFDKTGGQIQGDVIISGNLSVSGGYFVTYTEHVSAKDNLITINAGEQGAGVTAGVAGIEVDRGTLPKYDFFFVEASQSFRVGEEGNTQAVATREDAPVDQVIPFWNDAAQRFDTTETYLTPSFVRSLTGQTDTSLRTEVAGITSQLVSITASQQLQINTLAVSATNHEIRIQHLESEVLAISASLGAVYKGLEPGVVGQDVYTITHATVNTATDFPLVSLITPATSSTLYVQSITNRTATSFDTVLSGLPDETGYAISWQISTTSASIVVPSVSGNFVSKTGDETISGIKTFTSDLVINGKLTVDGLIDPTGLELVPQVANPGIVTANTLWLNSNDGDKLYIGTDPVGTGGSVPNVSGVGYWDVVSTQVTSQDLLTPTHIITNAAIYTSHDVSLQGYGFVDAPINMQNGQSINILMTQDAEPYDWDMEYDSDIEFPYGVPVVPTSGAEATTVVTLLKMRNRFFATGLFEFL